MYIFVPRRQILYVKIATFRVLGLMMQAQSSRLRSDSSWNIVWPGCYDYISSPWSIGQWLVLARIIWSSPVALSGGCIDWRGPAPTYHGQGVNMEQRLAIQTSSWALMIQRNLEGHEAKNLYIGTRLYLKMHVIVRSLVYWLQSILQMFLQAAVMSDL